MAFSHGVCNIKGGYRAIRLEEGAKGRKPLSGVQGFAPGTQAGKVPHKVGSGPAQAQAGVLRGFEAVGDGQVPLLYDGVLANGLFQKELVVFLSVATPAILPFRQQNGGCKPLPVQGMVTDGDLGVAAAFLGIQKGAVDMEFLLLFRPAG